MPDQSPSEGEQERERERDRERAVVPTEASRIQDMVRAAGGGGVENHRYVILAQFALAGLVWYTLSLALAFAWQKASFTPLFGSSTTTGQLLAAVLTIGGLVYALRNPVAQEFSTEVVVELRKVSWPSFKETRQTTLVVVVLVIINALILGGFDFLWAKLIKVVLSWGTETS